MAEEADRHAGADWSELTASLAGTITQTLLDRADRNYCGGGMKDGIDLTKNSPTPEPPVQSAEV